MENNIQITVSDLKKIIHLLLLKLNNLNEEYAFIMDKDLYWNILDVELYDIYKDPGDLTIGSLIEDWEFLQEALNGNREIIDYDLYKLAMILRYLGNSKIIG